MNTSAPSVGIGILNWNGKKFLEVLLPQLKKLIYSNYTIYVIDNTSTDGSLPFISEFHPEVKIIALDNNYGFAGGYNRGFAEMPEKYYVMLNADVEVPPGFINQLVEMMERDKDVAVCQPKLLSLSNPRMFEHGGAAGGMIDFLGYPFCRGRIFDTSEEDFRQYNISAEIFWASGACCMIRRAAYWKINGLYEFFFMHSEEIDMCWRLIAEGYQIMYCPTTFVYHVGGGSLPYQTPRKTYLNFRNNIIMCFRNSPWYILIWLLPARVGLDTIAALHFLLRKDKKNCKAVFKAYRDFMKWLVNEKNKFPKNTKSLLSIPSVFKKSIVWEYYIKGLKYYKEVKHIF
jgi:GT2 family glycosyltransferase